MFRSSTCFLDFSEQAARAPADFVEDENPRLSCMEAESKATCSLPLKQKWRYNVLLFGSLHDLLRHKFASLLSRLTGRSHDKSVIMVFEAWFSVETNFVPNSSFASQPTHTRLKNVLKSRSFCYRILRPPRFWRTHSWLSRTHLHQPM